MDVETMESGSGEEIVANNRKKGVAAESAFDSNQSLSED